jgi:hypothetical protein
MVYHDFRCKQCGKVFERRVSWDSDTIPCECGSEALRVFISHREYRAQSFDPVLIYRDKSGHTRFPGRNQGTVPDGYEPVYLRTTAEVRKFEREMNSKERERYFAHKERQEKRFEPWLANARSELRQKMQLMSPRGRDLAEAAMRENDRQATVDTRFDPAFRLEAFSQNAGNRDACYDRDMKRGK